jgi:hypothetical protein
MEKESYFYFNLGNILKPAPSPAADGEGWGEDDRFYNYCHSEAVLQRQLEFTAKPK